jgi:hypothetical protein
MTTEFVTDPIVPLELILAGGRGRYFTLYQPGWHIADDGSAGFLGKDGKVFGFPTLDDLVTFVDSGETHDLSPSPHMRQVRLWTTEEYERRLCTYDLTNLPEVADGHLDAEEQATLGSSLALMLDLLDYTGVEGEHAQALRDDDDIAKLAAGDEVLSVFRAAHHRQHVVELLQAHWSWCLSQVARRITTPRLPDSHNPHPTGNPGPLEEDGPIPLEDRTNAMTLWFGLAEEGVYFLRSTSLHDGRPQYVGKPRPGEHVPRLAVWTDLDQMRADLIRDSAPLDLPAVLFDPDVSLTPHDDCIFDLVVIGESIGPEMDVEAADRLVSAWTELVRLAAWGGWSDVEELVGPGSEVGTFVIGCAIDLAQGRPGAEQALASADTKTIAVRWEAVVPTLTAHLDIR